MLLGSPYHLCNGGSLALSVDGVALESPQYLSELLTPTRTLRSS